MRKKTKASPELNNFMKFKKIKFAEVFGFYPVDRASCPCQKEIFALKKRLHELSPEQVKKEVEKMKFYTCPRDKTGMKRYKIVCRQCNSIQGYLWATDPTIKDWCDFHYVQKSNGEEWFGCLTPHISPITEELHFECCCGQDTRDFRANTVRHTEFREKEKKARYGRDLGHANSKFIAIEVQSFKFPNKKSWLK